MRDRFEVREKVGVRQKEEIMKHARIRESRWG
jgi:hypothetical protein